MPSPAERLFLRERIAARHGRPPKTEEKMGAQVEHAVRLETTTCCKCGVVFGMPDYLIKSRREIGGGFFCVNWHPLIFNSNEVEQLKKQLAEEKRKLEWSRNEVQNEQRARARERAEKKLKRAEKRVRAGLCLDCNRHFTNLERHIHTKVAPTSKVVRVKIEGAVCSLTDADAVLSWTEGHAQLSNALGQRERPRDEKLDKGERKLLLDAAANNMRLKDELYIALEESRRARVELAMQRRDNKELLAVLTMLKSLSQHSQAFPREKTRFSWLEVD